MTIVQLTLSLMDIMTDQSTSYVTDLPVHRLQADDSALWPFRPVLSVGIRRLG